MRKIKYCFTTSRQNDAVRYQKESVWLAYCEVKNIPYIQLRRRIKRTDIHWDYISYPFALDGAFNGDHGARLRGEFREMFARVVYEIRDSTMSYMASGWTADFHDVPNSLADSLACELYDLVARHCLNFLAATEKHPA